MVGAQSAPTAVTYEGAKYKPHSPSSAACIVPAFVLRAFVPPVNPWPQPVSDSDGSVVCRQLQAVDDEYFDGCPAGLEPQPELLAKRRYQRRCS